METQSYKTLITICSFVNIAAFMIILPLLDFAFGVIFVIQRNYTNLKQNQNLVLYSFGKALYSQSRAS